jgi:hypothetical protein
MTLAPVLAVGTSAAGCTFGWSWTFEPNTTGARTGDRVARHEQMVPGDARVVASEALAAYGVELPEVATDVSMSEVDFERPGWMVADATLIAMDPPRDAVEPMLDWTSTGLFFPTGITAGEVVAPSLADLIGEPYDPTTPAVDWFVHSVDPEVPDRNIVVLWPPGDPATVRFVIYELPG